MLVHGVPGARYKSFEHKEDAEAFLKQHTQPASSPLHRAEKSTRSSYRESPLASSSSSPSNYRKEDAEAEPNETLKPSKTSPRKRKSSLKSSLTDTPPIIVYTDGACEGNGQSGSEAGVGVYFGNNDPRNVSEPLAGDRQTNQRAELTVRNPFAFDLCPNCPKGGRKTLNKRPLDFS